MPAGIVVMSARPGRIVTEIASTLDEKQRPPAGSCLRRIGRRDHPLGPCHPCGLNGRCRCCSRWPRSWAGKPQSGCSTCRRISCPVRSRSRRRFWPRRPSCFSSLASTLVVTVAALIASVVLGVGLAAMTGLSRWARAAILPWAIVLQVTPVVAIASADHHLDRGSVRLVGRLRDDRRLLSFVFLIRWPASRRPRPSCWTCSACIAPGRSERSCCCGLPAALPFFLAGLRVSGGLALVGAVVAEFVAGSGGVASGLAYRILEAGYRLQIPRMFAALVLLALAGLAINLGLGALERWALRPPRDGLMRARRTVTEKSGTPRNGMSDTKRMTDAQARLRGQAGRQSGQIAG